MRRALIVGGSGFIGQHLHRLLESHGWQVSSPARGDFHWMQTPQDIVFYCAGLTADFRKQPFATVEAHVHFLQQILQQVQFERLVYLSSTRVYQKASTGSEDSLLGVMSQDASDLYNLSKLMGESLALHSGRPVQIARLSNIYGKGMPSANFLADILRTAVRQRRLVFQTAPFSEKDYLHVEDACRYLMRIAGEGCERVYNVASGQQTQHSTLADWLATQQVACEFLTGAPAQRFPSVDVSRLHAAFGLPQHRLKDDLSELFSYYSEMP